MFEMGTMAEGSGALSRREFVTLAGAAAVTTLALGAVPGCAADDGAETGGVETPSTNYGGASEMGQRVLVGYATRTGSTVDVAQAIGEELGKRDLTVDVKPLKERPSLEGYDAVVLGSAVNGGAWLPEAVSFVESNRPALSAVPVAAFCVHIMNLGDDEKARSRRQNYLKAVRAIVTPVAEGFFAGIGPTREDSSLIMRWAFRAFGGGGEGDCRDWDAIRAWGATVELGSVTADSAL